jgi:hypothetical protein
LKVEFDVRRFVTVAEQLLRSKRQVHADAAEDL